MASEIVMYENTEQAMQEHEMPQGPQGGPSKESRISELKKCPYCAEMIQAEAIKCRYCGEFLDGRGRTAPPPVSKKWYFATGSIVLAVLCVGPLALPLVWLNPRYKPLTKVFITLIIIGVTVLAMYLAIYSYQQLLNQLTELGM